MGVREIAQRQQDTNNNKYYQQLRMGNQICVCVCAVCVCVCGCVCVQNACSVVAVWVRCVCGVGASEWRPYMHQNSNPYMHQNSNKTCIRIATLQASE